MPGFGGFEKPVAIKRMYAHFGSDRKFVEMLTDEAKIVSQLGHPNVVQILDVGETDGAYYIALEYIDGVDVFRLLQRLHDNQMDLPIEMAIYIAGELASALDYAHARRAADGTPLGIIHRDISPQNVLLSHLGEVKLTDFGIAKAAYRFTHTQAGVVKGKLYYMSPEHARGETLDHRSDLFSAGILLYEMLCTTPLYDEDDHGRLLSRVGRADYHWPPERSGRVPPPLRAVADRALSAKPQDRYQTGRELHSALVAVGRKLGLFCDRETLSVWLRELYERADDRPVPESGAWAVAETGEGEADEPTRAIAAMPDDDGASHAAGADAIGGDAISGSVVPSDLMSHGAQVSDLDEAGETRRVAPRPSKNSGARPPPLPTLLAGQDRKIGAADVPASSASPTVASEVVGASVPPPPLPLADAEDQPTMALPVVGPPAPPPRSSPVPQPPGAVASRPNSLRLTGRAPSSVRIAPAVRRPVASAPLVPAAGGVHDQHTSMLQIETAAPTADVRGQTPPPPVVSGPAQAPVADAPTQFLQALTDDGPPRVSTPHRPPTPIVSPIQAAAAVLPSRDPGLEPASWSLLGLTALVWAGVVVLGVYATLLAVN